MMPGKNPASATPSRNRIAWKLYGPLTKLIPIATMPQEIMIRAIQIRAPKYCSARLLGTSNRR